MRVGVTRSKYGAGVAAWIAALLVATIVCPAVLAAEAKPEASATVDINSATVEELASVPGIGQVIAQRIVEFREKNGPYKSLDDLLKVQGIGEKSLAKIRERLAVGKSKK